MRAKDFIGSREALRWAMRDVGDIDQVLPFVAGRTAAVQAGGCLGVYPRRLAELFETVYCFEPAPALFPLLVQNAPAENIVRFQAALGDERRLVGTSQTRRDGKPNPHEGITHLVPGGTIPTLRIDDLHLPVCDLIYLDTEGCELPALMGATFTLHRCRPVVVSEINKNLGFVGLTPEDVYQFMSAYRYRAVAKLHADEVFVPVERAA